MDIAIVWILVTLNLVDTMADIASIVVLSFLLNQLWNFTVWTYKDTTIIIMMVLVLELPAHSDKSWIYQKRHGVVSKTEY